jgi:hypothetical protein
MTPDYGAFLAVEGARGAARGLADVPPLGSHLFGFQREAVAFGLRPDRGAVSSTPASGKTLCELEWAAHAAAASNGRALILTPLAVAQQIAAEGTRFGYPSRVVRSAEDVREGVNICNYDRLHLLDPRRSAPSPSTSRASSRRSPARPRARWSRRSPGIASGCPPARRRRRTITPSSRSTPRSSAS